MRNGRSDIYLGLLRNTDTWAMVCQPNFALQTDLAHRVKVALIMQIKALRKLLCDTTNIPFDSQNMSILVYGLEVWGLKGCKKIESVHLYTNSIFLNVSQHITNDKVYEETLYLLSAVCLKILKMDENKLLKRVYSIIWFLITGQTK